MEISAKVGEGNGAERVYDILSAQIDGSLNYLEGEGSLGTLGTELPWGS